MTTENLIQIPVSSRMAESMSILSGMTSVLEAIKEEEAAGKNAPGFRLALARAEAVVADARATHAGNVLREVAKAGYDISKHPNVYSGRNAAGWYIGIEPEDLLSGLEP